MTSHFEVLDVGQAGALKVSGPTGGKYWGDHTPTLNVMLMGTSGDSIINEIQKPPAQPEDSEEFHELTPSNQTLVPRMQMKNLLFK